MNTYDSPDAGPLRRYETAYPSFALGWPQYYRAINSLAPLGNVFTTSTGEPQSPLNVSEALEPQPLALVSVVRRVRVELQERQALNLKAIRMASQEWADLLGPFLESSTHRCEGISALDVFIGEEALSQERPIFPVFRGNVSRRVVRRSRIEIASGVDTYARAAGVLDDVSIIGELCLRLVPEAKRVAVTVTRDPEDGTTGLHFRVQTAAPIETVVAAEDELHEALFERIPPARRHRFSIGYEFAS